jgi:hypothetical protein
MTLTDKSLQECVNLYCGACERWTVELLAAAKSSKSVYCNKICSVMGECCQIEIFVELSDLPSSLREMMSPQLTRKFANLIRNFNSKVRKLNLSFWNEVEHYNLCVAMFCSVLTPYVYQYNEEFFSDRFTWILVVLTLDIVPGLRALYYKTGQDTFSRIQRIYSTQLARMIHHLRHLQEFSHHFHCTDEVIEQLALNCSHLKEVSLYGSGGVTNAAVPHLLQLKELQFLQLNKTKISIGQYGLLLSQLPQIKNINFSREYENLFYYITVKKLDSISHVKGNVPNMNMLTQRCRNITNLNFHPLQVDLSSLAALIALRTLNITNVDYAIYNLNAVLTSIGPRLTRVSLNWIENVNLQDIVTLCPSLKSITFRKCSILPLKTDAPLDPQLPHFKNLISLSIIDVRGGETMVNALRYYVSLKRIHLHDIRIFTDGFMREVLDSGAFANLEEFAIREYCTRALTMEAFELLIERCSHLKIIRGLETCRQIRASSIQELKHRLLLRNLDLEIKEVPF